MESMREAAARHMETAFGAAEVARAHFASLGAERFVADGMCTAREAAERVRAAFPAEMKAVAKQVHSGLVLALTLLALKMCWRTRHAPVIAEEVVDEIGTAEDVEPPVAPAVERSDPSAEDLVEAVVPAAERRRSCADSPPPVPRRQPLAEVSQNSAEGEGRREDLLRAVNTRSFEELTKLPGIGAKSADKIKKHQGDIASLEDLVLKVGISRAVMTKILHSQGIPDDSLQC